MLSAVHRDRYDIIAAAEKITSERMHKAGPLQMIGLCLLYAEKPEEAFTQYAAAHVENVVSDGPNGARLYGAYYTLNRGYGLSESDLQTFSDWIITQSDWDPFQTLHNYEQKLGKPLLEYALRRNLKITWQRLKMDQMPSEFQKRVFLAGSYGNILWLKRIENAIIELNEDYYPVLALNFEKPSKMITDDFTTALLSKCKHAVFEISELGRGGFLTELPRARDLKVHSLGIYQSTSGSPSPQRFSEELDWLRKQPYTSLENMKKMLRRLL